MRKILFPLLIFVIQGMSLPLNPQVQFGELDLVLSPRGMEIHVGEEAWIHWDDFSIDPGERVEFRQPSDTSIAVNQVVKENPSHLFGTLSANGSVVLINPNGVMFGRGSEIHVGNLIASSLDLNREQFLEHKRLEFHKNPNIATGSCKIHNFGSIESERGVLFLGANVGNHGKIYAGETVGLIGTMACSFDLTYKPERANFVPIDTTSVQLYGDIAATDVFLLGGSVLLHEGTIDISRTENVGKVFVGGGFQGGEFPRATYTYVDEEVSLLANSQEARGGQVVIWSEKGSYFYL